LKSKKHQKQTRLKKKHQKHIKQQKKTHQLKEKKEKKTQQKQSQLKVTQQKKTHLKKKEQKKKQFNSKSLQQKKKARTIRFLELLKLNKDEEEEEEEVSHHSTDEDNSDDEEEEKKKLDLHHLKGKFHQNHKIFWNKGNEGEREAHHSTHWKGAEKEVAQEESKSLHNIYWRRGKEGGPHKQRISEETGSKREKSDDFDPHTDEVDEVVDFDDVAQPASRRTINTLQTGLDVTPVSNIDLAQPIDGEMPHAPFHPVQMGIQPTSWDFMNPSSPNSMLSSKSAVSPTKRESMYPGMSDYDLTPEKILEANAKMESGLPIAGDENHSPDFRNEARNTIDPEQLQVMPEMHEMEMGQRISNAANQAVISNRQPSQPITDASLVSESPDGFSSSSGSSQQRLAQKPQRDPATESFHDAIEDIQNKERNIGSEVKTALEDAVQLNEEAKDNSLVSGEHHGGRKSKQNAQQDDSLINTEEVK